MWGNSDKQINRIFNIGANQIGESRHNAKLEQREKGNIRNSDISKKVGVFSYGTSNTYVPVWKELAKFAETKGIKDIESLSNKKVKDYLKVKIHDVKCYSSFSKVCSAVLKFQGALNKYSEVEKTGKTYNFEKAVTDMRKYAIGKSNDKSDKSMVKDQGLLRGFEKPQIVVDNITNTEHRFCAQIQSESGCRIHEISQIRDNQLKGLGKDPYNGKEVGVVTIVGKGGKQREVYLKPDTYNKLAENIKNSGIFKVGKSAYTNSVKEAANSVGQKYSGTHDFRHSWVQNRFAEVQKMGFSNEQSLRSVSEEIGHVRGDITEVYLK
jgi:integrase